MMAILTRIVEQFAVLLLAMGIPAGQAALYALILIYLLVTGLFAVLLIFLLLRRRQRASRKVLTPSDRES